MGRGVYGILQEAPSCDRLLSFHIYSEYPQLKAEQNILTKMMPPTFYKESIHRLQDKMALASFRDMESHITEWNFSLYDRHLARYHVYGPICDVSCDEYIGRRKGHGFLVLYGCV